MTKDEALRMALEALETCEVAWPGTRFKSKYFAEDEVKAAITAIKQARALDKKAENARDLGLDYEPCCKDQTCPKCKPAAVQEPVIAQEGDTLEIETILYTSPQRTWVGLTDEEILKLAYPIRWQEVDDFEADKAVNFAQAIEAKLKEKNNG